MGIQIAFCPFETAPAQPSFAYWPPPLLASKTPVLYTVCVYVCVCLFVCVWYTSPPLLASKTPVLYAKY
jgi:hypothetical protein